MLHCIMNIYLEAFGMLSVIIMVASYAFESAHRHFVALFSFGCMLASIYALLIGSYSFFIAEGVWAVIAIRRWTKISKSEPAI